MSNMKIYVVHDYDHVSYVGTSLKDAKQNARRGHIEVWQNGKHIHNVTHHSVHGWQTEDYP